MTSRPIFSLSVVHRLPTSPRPPTGINAKPDGRFRQHVLMSRAQGAVGIQSMREELGRFIAKMVECISSE